MRVHHSDGYKAELLSWDQFEQFWPGISEMMDKIPHTWEDLTKESIYARTENSSLQVWGVGCGDALLMVLFSQIAVFASGRALQIIWGAGQGRVFESAGDVVDAAMESFAKDQHCSRIDVIGRGGWEKVLAKRGFKRSAVVLSRRVVHGGMQ